MSLPDITDFQEWVLRETRRQELLKPGGAPLTREISSALYESDQNRYATRKGQRWTSRYEAASPHINSLIRKGLMERPERGKVRTTALGRKWLKANQSPTG